MNLINDSGFRNIQIKSYKKYNVVIYKVIDDCDVCTASSKYLHIKVTRIIKLVGARE